MLTARLLYTETMPRIQKQFTLHFETVAQCDSLDRPWFGEVWFLMEKNESDVNYAQT